MIRKYSRSYRGKTIKKPLNIDKLIKQIETKKADRLNTIFIDLLRKYTK